MDAYEGYDDVVPPTGDGFDADGAGAGGAGGIDDLDGPLVVAAGDAAYFVDGLVGGPGAAGGNEALEEDAVIDNVVLKFLGNFQRAVREQNTGEIQNIYESSWNALSERFYAKSSWPSGNAVAAHFNDEDPIFLILYKELYFRHLYMKAQPTLEQRFESFENYCDLFNYIINSDGPVSLELPVQWLWDIVDEFIFQFQVFCHYRSNLSNKSDDEIDRLREAPQIWNVQTVMNILHSLADKANIVEQLRVSREGGNAAEAAGAYGQLNLYKMLGYFSLVGLLRLHCLLGDYYLALRSVDYLDMELNKKALFARVTACHITTFYYVAFAYVMLRRYRDAGVTLSNILFFLARTKQYHARATQYDQFQKMTDRMYSMLAICSTLLPQRLEENVENTLREKQGDNIDRVLRSADAEAVFEEWFTFASPKFVAPIAPDYDALLGNNLVPEPLRYQLRLFLTEVRQQLSIPTQRSVMKLYTTMPVAKLATFLNAATESDCRSQLMCYKHKTRALRWQSGPLITGSFEYTGDLNFYITDNLLHISVSKPQRRHSDFFITQINGFVEVLTTLNLTPPTPTPAPAPSAAAAPASAGATAGRSAVSVSARS